MLARTLTPKGIDCEISPRLESGTNHSLTIRNGSKQTISTSDRLEQLQFLDKLLVVEHF